MTGLPELEVALDALDDDALLKTWGRAPAEEAGKAEAWYPDGLTTTTAPTSVANLNVVEITDTKSVNLDGFYEVETSGELLDQVRDHIDDISGVVNSALLVAADTLVRARTAYEQETGTGKGKRNPDGVLTFVVVAAEKLMRSPSFVERLLRLAQLDGTTRERVAEIPKLMCNQDALLALAREPIPERRHLAVDAFKDGGRVAMNRVLNTILVDTGMAVDLDEHTQSGVLEFLSSYAEAKQAAAEAEARYRESKKYEEPKAVQQRRANAEAVFERLRGGENRLNPEALEMLGMSRSICNRAVKDLIYSDMIEATGDLDSYEVGDGKDITHLELVPSRKQALRLTMQLGTPMRRKLAGGAYEISLVAVGDSGVEILLKRA
jgi:hypothetical protein